MWMKFRKNLCQTDETSVAGFILISYCSIVIFFGDNINFGV